MSVVRPRFAEAVDHDVTARGHPRFPRSSPVGGIRIGRAKCRVMFRERACGNGKRDDACRPQEPGRLCLRISAEPLFAA